jgi:hypothetical protein
MIAAVSFAAVCGDADDGAPPQNGRTLVDAPIDELELIVRESAPPQYAVRIVSGLPNGCAEFADARVTGRSGNETKVQVRNTIPSDPNVVCTAIYGTHEEIVDLGSDFTSGQSYVVRVNDKTLEFTAQ